jgi:hypothetical protein
MSPPVVLAIQAAGTAVRLKLASRAAFAVAGDEFDE